MLLLIIHCATWISRLTIVHRIVMRHWGSRIRSILRLI